MSQSPSSYRDGYLAGVAAAKAKAPRPSIFDYPPTWWVIVQVVNLVILAALTGLATWNVAGVAAVAGAAFFGASISSDVRARRAYRTGCR